MTHEIQSARMSLKCGVPYGGTGDRIVADFGIKGFGEGWLLTPTSRISRAWCQSNLADKIRKCGDGYVVEEQLMLQIIERFIDQKPRWFVS